MFKSSTLLLSDWMHSKKQQNISSYRWSKTPKFHQRDPQVPVRKYFHSLRPSACSRITSHPRYQERLSPHSGASGRHKIPRNSLGRSLVSMDCPPIRIQRKTLFFLQNIAADNSASASIGIRCCKRIWHLIPLNILINVDDSLVQPHFNCCSVVWGNCGCGLSEKLQKL